MTMAHTEIGESVRRQMNKLLVTISSMAFFSFLALLPLWRSCLYSPNAKFSAVLYALPALVLYILTVVVLLRLKKKLDGI